MTRIDSLRFKLRRFLSKEWVTSLIMISIVIGAASGVASIIFYIFLREFHQFFFKYILNYHIPEPSNPEFDVNWVPLNPFLLLVTSVGGLVSGILVYKFAPEAEGHGTDAAIAAFHRYAGDVRARVPLIKILASVFTIGSGGSAGREGPMAQIGSGVASLLSKVLGLPSRIRRLSVAVGIGAGIGSIFKAPLG
ncbi:chloride channel protein, partial [Candidatus Geothermarchaeota archaeon]